jgi:hypothetical protein
MTAEGNSDSHKLVSILMGLHEQVKPFHEFLQGQRQLLRDQGYTDDEARAMAAAVFVSLFGSHISRTVADETKGDDSGERN